MQSDDELIDSEEKTSIIEVKDRIFLEEADEFEKEGAGDSEDEDEQKEAERPIEANSEGSGSSRRSAAPMKRQNEPPKDNRNYIADPKESFVAVDAGVHPQKLEPPVFNKSGSGKYSVLMLKDKSHKLMTDYLLGLLIDHVIKMYNFNRSPEIKELAIAQFRVWLGIHFMTYSWRLPVSKRYWSSRVYVVEKISSFNSVTPYVDFVNFIELVLGLVSVRVS